MNICLSLVVKNESSNIINYLNLNKEEFNMLFIVNINSDDNSIELIKDWCIINNISLIIHKSNEIISGNNCIKLARTLCPNVLAFKIID